MEFLEDAYIYDFEGISKNGIYEYRFVSIGNTEITKVVGFSPLSVGENIFNLGFGNLEFIDGEYEINDHPDLNNADFEKVLSTVFKCVLHFLRINSTGTVLFFGNTEHKHILYLRKVAVHLNELETLFNVLGGCIGGEIKKVEQKKQASNTKGNRERIVRIKNITSEVFNSKITLLEKFDKAKSRDYHFVALRLKSSN
jgi:hypothetical protein